MFIRDERALETWLIKRAVESRVVVLPDGTEMTGEELETAAREAHGVPEVSCRSSSAAGRRAMSSMALLERDARDKGFFADRERVEALAQALTTPARDGDACSPTKSTRRSRWPSRTAAAAIRATTASIRIS